MIQKTVVKNDGLIDWSIENDCLQCLRSPTTQDNYLVEEQRRQILHLESIPRMTKQELTTPDKDINRKLFDGMGQSSQSHSQNDPPGDSSGSNQPQQSTPPQSHLIHGPVGNC